MPSKRILKLQASFDRNKSYPIAEAVAIIKKTASKKFDETIEVHAKLGIDPKKGEQQVRSNIVLPHSFGATKKVAAFVTEDKRKTAKEAGADIVYAESDIAELIKSGKIEFDVAVAIPEIMKNLAPMAKILGPKGLMPSPKNETVTQNLTKIIGELKKGKIAFKNDDTSNLHQAIAKVRMPEAEILANFEEFYSALKKAKPETSKGTFIKSLTVCSTMGPSIKVEIK